MKILKWWFGYEEPSYEFILSDTSGKVSD